MKLSYFYPLLGFVVPTVLIGFGLVIPKSCIAGINDLTIGFTITVVSACIAYWMGLRTVLRDVTSLLHNSDEIPEWRVRIIVQHEGQIVASS
jgi:ABC-type Fe3+ transport system permease subunit